MSFDRRTGGRPGGRPGGTGRPSGFKRPAGERPYAERPFGERSERAERPDRPPRDRSYGESRPPRAGGFGDSRPPRPAGFAPRVEDEGGMNIRLDPRRLSALKALAGEAGLRPGELVTRWVEERLDAARGGARPAAAEPSGGALATIMARLDELTRRVDALGGTAGKAKPAAAVEARPEAIATEAPAEEAVAAPVKAPAKRGPGRPRKSPAPAPKPARGIALHEELAAIIAERGPLSAVELAAAVAERGRYAPPRSAKPLDAATVSARVSNPVYKSRFVRRAGKIGLAVEPAE
jgi:hypothetical protein